MIAKLPNDREGVVYLAYDLYYLGRYDEALALVNKYQNTLTNDKICRLLPATSMPITVTCKQR